MLQKIKNYPRLGLVLLTFAAFIALGMPDGLMGVAWPSVRADFSVPLDALGMLMIAAMIGYMTSSFTSGFWIGRFGVGKLLAVSCALTGLGLIGYTLVPAWWMMVTLGVAAGLGAGAIDSGLNTYVAANFGEGLMQWLHASYGIGITMGPLIMTSALTLTSSWRLGYQVVGGFQLVMALCFVATLPMWATKTAHPGAKDTPRLTDYKTPYGETLRKPAVWLSILLFFIYTGAEVGLGAWAYSLLTEARGVDPEVAGLWTGSYWAMFTVGRVLAGLFAKRIGVNGLVRGSVLGALLGSFLLWWNPLEIVSLLGVAVIGLSIAPIFPAMVSGTSQRVSRRYAANTIGIQMGGASLGATAIPALIGVLARRISLEVVPVVLFTLFALLFILYALTIKLKIQDEDGGEG